MPYYYIAKGWSHSGGPIYPNGLPQKTTFFKPANGSGSQQWINNVDITEDLIAVVDPKWQATRNLWAPGGTYAKDFNGTSACDYFGNMYSATATPPPQAVGYDLGSERIRPKSSWKEFQKRKERGEIVVNPIESYAASAMVHPGVHSNHLYQVSSGMLYRRSQYGAFPRVWSANFNRYGWQFPCQGENSLTDSEGWHQIIHSVIDRYTIPAGVNPWYMASEAEVRDLANLVRGAVVSDPKPGVITAALAEANNKNWDILTEVAEAPEAIRYIFGVLKQILKLCKDFRNEVKRLRRQYYSVKGGGSHKAALVTILSQKWLEFRYAMSPLVYTAQTAIDYLLTGQVEYQTTRKREKEDITIPHDDWLIDPILVSHRCFIKRRFAYEWDTFSSNSNYLTMNPLSTAWEATLLSFVVDWAFNVGDYLSTLMAPSGIVDQGSTFSSHLPTARIRCRHKRHLGAEVILTLGVYKAVVINPPDHTGLVVDLNLNWKRTLDGLSLMWQATKRSHSH